MPSSNKSMGNAFERDLCVYLSRKGFWAYNTTQNADGQPADIISARNGKAYLIDAKVCSKGNGKGNGFEVSRIEENQMLAMGRWESCGNGCGWFAIRFSGEDVVMISLPALMDLAAEKSFLSYDELYAKGLSLETWVKLCR